VRETGVTASVCMTVTGPSRDGGVTARALERWPGGTAELVPGPGRPWLAHTNHFLGSIDASDRLASGEGSGSTHDRLTQLRRAMEANPAAGTAEVSALLSTRGARGLEPIFRIEDTEDRWLLQCATLATIAMESPSGRMWLRGTETPDGTLEPV
jgi:hypothetical protein